MYYFAAGHIVYEPDSPDFHANQQTEHEDGLSSDEGTRYAQRIYLCRMSKVRDASISTALFQGVRDRQPPFGKWHFGDVTIFKEAEVYTIVRRSIGLPKDSNAFMYDESCLIDDYLPTVWRNLTRAQALDKCRMLQGLCYFIPDSVVAVLSRRQNKPYKRNP